LDGWEKVDVGWIPRWQAINLAAEAAEPAMMMMMMMFVCWFVWPNLFGFAPLAIFHTPNPFAPPFPSPYFLVCYNFLSLD